MSAPALGRVGVQSQGQSCPDCLSTPTGERWFRHQPLCPIAVGLARQATEDRQWFRAHPGQTTRTRALTWAERQLLIWFVTDTLEITIDLFDGDSIGVSDFHPDVEVVRYGEGGHTRYFAGELLVVHGSGGANYGVPEWVQISDLFDHGEYAGSATTHVGPAS